MLGGGEHADRLAMGPQAKYGHCPSTIERLQGDGGAYVRNVYYAEAFSRRLRQRNRQFGHNLARQFRSGAKKQDRIREVVTFIELQVDHLQCRIEEVPDCSLGFKSSVAPEFGNGVLVRVYYLEWQFARPPRTL
jgi:hypothetical protein